MNQYPSSPALHIAIQPSQYVRMPAHNVSVKMMGADEPMEEKRILPEVKGVAGKSFTIGEVTMPNVPGIVND
jgi:hypothetical protein